MLFQKGKNTKEMRPTFNKELKLAYNPSMGSEKSIEAISTQIFDIQETPWHQSSGRHPGRRPQVRVTSPTLEEKNKSAKQQGDASGMLLAGRLASCFLVT